MEDMIEQANEIQESMGRSYGVPEEIDEAELEAGQLRLLISWRSGHVIEVYPRAELDALQNMEEEETPSYLQDIHATPDFIDEAPIEDRRVSWPSLSQPMNVLTASSRLLIQKLSRRQSPGHECYSRNLNFS